MAPPDDVTSGRPENPTMTPLQPPITTASPIETTATTTGETTTPEPPKLEVSLKLTSVTFTPTLNDKNSAEFKNLAANVANTFDLLFINVNGYVKTIVLGFR
ncbi:uncharacterized protein LOC144909050 [Branchiostoma floridae x Branchiostoma belcheri]